MTIIHSAEDPMRLDIRGRHLTLTPALRDRATRRLHFALGRFHRRVGRVTVRLGDVNGPGGGVDKFCRVELHAAGRRITIEELDADMYAAIDRAAERVGRAVERAVARRAA